MSDLIRSKPSNRIKDLSSRRFGSLLVMRYAGHKNISKNKRNYWLCKCDCGAEVDVLTASLIHGKSTSCGCGISKSNDDSVSFNPKNYRHGRCGTRLYRIWSGIKSRCLNESCNRFDYYGARGITICEEWKNDFSAFAKDMGEPPSPRHSIDRIDNNQGYCKGNCRWATPDVQARNKRNSLEFHNGIFRYRNGG